MSDFEDEIRKKLEEGQITSSSPNWNQMEKKLSEETQFTPLEKNIHDSLLNVSIPLPIGSWINFLNNVSFPNTFEVNISNKLNNGKIEFNPNHWEQFSEKLADSKLTPTEGKFKRILNSKEISYNYKHWKAIEQVLKRKRSKKIFWKVAAAFLVIIGGWLFINEISTESQVIEIETNKPENDKIKNLNLNISNNTPKGILKLKNTFTDQFFLNSKTPKKNHIGQILIVDSNNLKPPLNQFENIHTSILVGFKRIEMCAPVEFIFKEIFSIKKPKQMVKLHSGATMWINFWENPAFTGFYGENNASTFYFNDWEIVDEDKNKLGELNFVQPLLYIGGYEKRLTHNWAIGGYLKYQLKKNWINREFNTSLSYTKTILNKLQIKLGAGASYHTQKLAVNKLTLREKMLNSNYILTTNLGSIRSKQEQSANYHLGGMINHKNFFIAYTALNFKSNYFTNKNNLSLVKHFIISGVHLPEFKKIQVSGLLKIEKDIFRTISPAIGITYNNQLFTNIEYEDLSSRKITVGYQLKNRVKAQFNYSIRELEAYKAKELNLDKFNERIGYISAGFNFTF